MAIAKRPTTKTHAFQQLARDETLSRITVLLHPILHARPHACRIVLGARQALHYCLE
jgi:hypothetical protein